MEAAANGSGHNSDLSPEQLSELKTLHDRIVQNEAKRSALGAEINADRKKIKSFQLDLDAYKAAKRRAEMDPQKRNEFDRSLDVCTRVIGIPPQPDFFEGGESANGPDIPAGPLN